MLQFALLSLNLYWGSYYTNFPADIWIFTKKNTKVAVGFVSHYNLPPSIQIVIIAEAFFMR
jgi:flavin-dependent dehydrogenase